MAKRKNILAMILTFTILIGNVNTVFANYGSNHYTGEDFKLEKMGTNVYVTAKYPNTLGGYENKTIYLIKNVSRILPPINYKVNFDEGAGPTGTDELPYLEIDGPLHIESLRDDMFFDTYLYDKIGSRYKGTGIRFYMDGTANYLIYKDDKDKGEIVSIKTGEVKNKIKEWTESKIKYELAGYDRKGEIFSEDGKVSYKRKDTNYSYFLLRGQNWRDNEELPRIFLKFKNDDEVEIADIEFKDIKKTDWFFNYIIKLVSLGGVNGFTDGTFRPNERIKVGEFLKMSLSSITGEEYVNGNYTIHWAENVYDIAIEKGIITEKDFKKDKKTLESYISREDMAYIIANINEKIQGNKKIDTEGLEKEIKDFEEISYNRQEQVLQAYAKDIIKGKPMGFDPKGETTRAEATAVIVRILK